MTIARRLESCLELLNYLWHPVALLMLLDQLLNTWVCLHCTIASYVHWTITWVLRSTSYSRVLWLPQYSNFTLTKNNCNIPPTNLGPNQTKIGSPPWWTTWRVDRWLQQIRLFFKLLRLSNNGEDIVVFKSLNWWIYKIGLIKFEL